MKIHEYQAKQILAKYGVPVPKGGVADSPEGAKKLADDLGGKAVVKAQVHAGGRGKAGGVKLVSSSNEAGEYAKSILGTNLVTFQTGPVGVPVRKVLVEEIIDVGDELYLAMVIDGAAEGVVAIASQEGGMDIEQVADETPDKILRVAIDPVLGIQPYQGRQLAYGLKVKPELVGPITALVESLYKVFQENDCSLVEINPLVITSDDRVLAVDAKLTIDDDAMFRHKDLDDLYDPEQEDPGEVEARKFDINYVKLDGTVGCIVNGAGLAMATMDVVLSGGAKPANFLDIGGGADEDKVANALRIVLMDSDVELVLVNIFGGILRCDVAARGLVQHGKADPSAMRPMVVRMLGTNAEEGRKTLQESDLDVTLVEDLAGAAEAIRAATS
ncbi:MAG: ADP-forming succinate--CoA ligase subunit beta [Chloroflexi bacterium]|nr:ADP-forming succinate--CoA ligase subunit beta [Chloroflexota bacterium]MDA1226638.1 ADP-forming succinate--CoA ligase subunit beta [Chloroflexota bacterium]